MNERFRVLDGTLNPLFESNYGPIAFVGVTSHEMSRNKRIEVHSDLGLSEQCQLQALGHQRGIACW